MAKYIKHLLFTAMSWGLSSSDDEILVGGQAVIEGVMMRSPKGYSVAVRRPDGTIRILKDALLSLGEKFKFFKLPIVRGVGVLGQALVLGIRALRFSAEEALRAEDLKKQVEDRKSTRLNSSHVRISYAVFCLKKKHQGTRPNQRRAAHHLSVPLPEDVPADVASAADRPAHQFESETPTTDDWYVRLSTLTQCT